MPGMVAIGFIEYLLIHPVPQKYHGHWAPRRSGKRLGEDIGLSLGGGWGNRETPSPLGLGVSLRLLCGATCGPVASVDGAMIVPDSTGSCGGC